VTFESDLYAALSGAAGLVALVGDEIVPSHESEGVTAGEFVVYTVVFDDTRYALTGPLDYRKVRVQVDCYASADLDGAQDVAMAIADAVIAAIPTSGWPLHRTAHSEQDLGLETETRLFRRMLEFSIFHRST
jgi:hypothetical protein